MKKLLIAVVAIAMLLFANPVYADTVRIVSKADSVAPAASFNDPPTQNIGVNKLNASAVEYAFRGPDKIKFTVADKKCELNGSNLGSVPMGCNYTVTVNADGSLSGDLRAGNSVCTQAEKVAASCK